MKTIIKVIAGVAAALSLTACNDFLDREPFDQVSPTGEINDEVAVALTNACYVTLQSGNMYNMRIWTLDIVAGNSLVGGAGGTDGIETIQASNFVAQSDNGMALYMWRSPWVGIGHCNDAIRSLESAEGVDPDLRDRCLGEAYFLRAHYYYVLARLYGGLPLRIRPHDAGQNPAIARASLDDTYKFIIGDVTEAIGKLPAKAEYDAANVGRACREAALYMLADIYLTLAPSNPALYGEVLGLCDEIDSYGWSLSSPYAENFNPELNNGPESIFEVQYSGSTEYDFWGNTPQMSQLSCFMGPRNSDMVAGSYGWNLPTEEFMSQYEEGDRRKDVTVLYDGCPDFDGKSYRPSWSTTGYNVRKFLVPKSISPEYNTSPANFVVYRYAGVLLMQAEALCELRRTGEAVVPLNEVRARAGLAGLRTDIGYEELREAIIHERRMEFAFEGHRWFDLIRIDNGEYALKFLHSIGRLNATRERLLFPIPQTEIDSNPLMTQNPGY